MWRYLYTVQCTDPDLGHTAKTQYRKFETNPHSCVCEGFIYSHLRPAYSTTGKCVD